MRHLIPFYSQHLDVSPKKWKNRSCGIVALKMVMDFWGMQRTRYRPIGFTDLIKKGVKNNAYIPKIGWRHKGLVRIAKQYGFSANNHDDAALSDGIAFRHLREHLFYGPVIASIHRNLNPKSHGHLVVISKIEKNDVYYSDPDSYTRRAVPRKAPKKKFIRGWKKRIITVRPRRLRKKG